MDIALLVFSVLGLIMGCLAIQSVRQAKHELMHKTQTAMEAIAASRDHYDDKAKEMGEASVSLGNLHNEQTAKVKAILERLEVLEIRFHGVNPQASKRAY